MKTAIKAVLDNIEEICIVVFFSIMFICMFLQLFTRYLFTIPLFFTEEVSRFSYVWLTFIGASYAIKRSSHIRIDVFAMMMPAKVRLYLRLLVDGISILLFIYLVYWGVQFAGFTAIIQSPALEMSMFYVAISIPIGFSLATIRGMKLLIADIRQARVR